MIINLKVTTLDSQTHEFSIDNEITIRQFKDKIAEKINIAAEQQRIIYCGHVLADETKVKEYDVDGKVVHVVERPPPSAMNSENTASSSSSVTLTPSLTPFCVNRITVARHMLNCANNIAAYLEDPERGLNNPSLDILAQGRWSVELTVLEIGGIQQNQSQNIVEALQQGTVSAIRQSSNANVTVLQFPRENGTDPASDQSDTDNQSSNDSTGLVEPMDDATTENVINGAGTEATAPHGNPDQTDGAATITTSTRNADSNPNRRRTRTNVLAEVIQQMRTVQARMNPFVDQYYELLQNEPTFEENDTTGRENTQRLFNRVSEAFHYLSHAQHAISDLTLDLSQPSPRYLCCRPYLFRQRSYVASNNYMASASSSAGSAPDAAVENGNAANGITTTPPTTPASGASNSADSGRTTSGLSVVSAAPIDADTASMRPQDTTASTTAETQASSTQQSTSTATTPTASDSTNTKSGDTNQARVTTATHPTTSTQTRSTARPQMQVPNIPFIWSTRMVPANTLSSFDRYLPCSSAHIRNAEARTNNNNNGVNQQFTRPNSTSSAGNADPSAASTTPTTRGSSSSTSSSVTIEQLNLIGNICRLNRLRRQLVSFIITTVFDGEPITQASMSTAVERAIHYINDILILLPQFDNHGYNSCASIEKLVRTSMPLIINLIIESHHPTDFESRLITALKQLVRRIFGIMSICVGRRSAQMHWTQIKHIVLYEIRKHIQGEGFNFLQMQIRTRTPNTETESILDDVKPFLVVRDPSATSRNNEVTPMDIDSCSASGSASSSSNFDTSAITAFSDTFMSEMVAKKRKLMQLCKPSKDVKSLIERSVWRAIQIAEIEDPSSSIPTHIANEISNAIATDSSVQATSSETLRSSVKERLKTDSEFNADKFPHTSKYFNKQN